MSGPNPKTQLTAEQREDITRRVLAGEKQGKLAQEYGCSRAYISLLKREALNPEKFRAKQEERLTRKLTEIELERLKEDIRSSTPHGLGLDPPILQWDTDHVLQLAQRLFQKKPSVRILKECLACAPARPIDPLTRRPQPPQKHHISQLSRELAADEDFVKYYLSPAAERLAWRQYELAIADWQARFGDAEVAELRDDPDAPDPDESLDFASARPMANIPAHGQRSGKHAKGKSKPKHRKRKRRR